MIRKPLIIGFGYRRRQGKDYAAARIIEQRDFFYDVRRYSFATELKREVTGMIQMMRMNNNQTSEQATRELCQLHRADYDSDPIMDDPDSPLGKQVSLLQKYGTEYRRALNPDYWVNQVMKRIADEKPQVALITDVRFPNETAICDYTIKVTRSDFTPPADEHISEKGLDGHDFSFEISVLTGDVERLKHEAIMLFDDMVDQYVFDNEPQAQPQEEVCSRSN